MHLYPRVCAAPPGAPLTVFGRDAEASGRSPTWSALFELDSDGDGLTNGEELGDPEGLWSIGDPNPAGDISDPNDPNDPGEGGDPTTDDTSLIPAQQGRGGRRGGAGSQRLRSIPASLSSGSNLGFSPDLTPE